MSDSYLGETRNPGRSLFLASHAGTRTTWGFTQVGGPRFVNAKAGLIRRGILARRPIMADPRRQHLLDVVFGPTADAGYQTNERFPQVR